MINQTSLNWQKSSLCESAQCVEVAALPDGGVAVRDSKQGEQGPVLHYTREEWQAFVCGVARGDFAGIVQN